MRYVMKKQKLLSIGNDFISGQASISPTTASVIHAAVVAFSLVETVLDPVAAVRLARY
jgi:hypothetical protein